MNSVLWNIGRRICKPLFFGPYGLRVVGPHRAPQSGATLVICNHLSNLDPPIVGSAILPRQVHFMAKSELFDKAVIGWILSGIGAFPVARGGADRDAIRTSKEILARDECLVMFPEGTRSLTGKLRPFFPGAGMLALEPGVTVIPAGLWGSQRGAGPLRVAFGPPLDLDGLTGSKSERAREATRRMMVAVGELIEQAGGPPQVVPTEEPTLERY